MVELVLRLGLSLGIVLGLFWAIAQTSSRRMAGSRSLLKVRGRQSLSRTASVAVVEVGNRVLVVGVSEGGVKLLTELDPEEIAEPAETPQAGTGPTGGSTAGKRRATTTATPALGGSILAPDTWKSAWAAATSRPAAGHAARSALVEPIHD
jgi:flagellar protein FliO/FliZ